MKIISWNVNGIRACYKKNLAGFLELEKPDVFCVQETKAHREQVEIEVQNLKFKNADWFSAQKKGYSGVATFHNDPAVSTIVGLQHVQYDFEGRVLRSVFPQFELYNIYFPNGGSGPARHDFKQNFLKDLSIHLREKVQSGTPLIVVGDYNVAHRAIDIYDPVRLASESGFLPEERAWFDGFLKMGFVDTFRHFYPDAKDRYSWWSYREFARVSNRGWRIDFICCTENLRKHLVSAEILDNIEGSDHCPVVAQFAF